MKGDCNMKFLRVPLMFIISFLIIGLSFMYYVDTYESEDYLPPDHVFSEYKKPVTLEELNQISEEEKAKRREEYLATNKECYTPEPDKYRVNVIDEYKELYENYEHLYGWLKIDGTKIDDPVMYTPWYQDYYLDKDIDGKYFQAGTLFIGKDSVFYPNYCNIIIHGHNMKNQTKFGSLKRYRSKAYYDEHKVIHFDTLEEKADYIVVAAFYARIRYVNEEGFRYYRHDYFNNLEEFDDYMANIKAMSFYDTGVDVEYGDSLITLSTCSYHTENGRFVVVAKKMTDEDRKRYLTESEA